MDRAVDGQSVVMNVVAIQKNAPVEWEIVAFNGWHGDSYIVITLVDENKGECFRNSRLQCDPQIRVALLSALSNGRTARTRLDPDKREVKAPFLRQNPSQ
jgi:hypothetical protein